MAHSTERKEKRMPRTVRSRKVQIGDKYYEKCPYPGCGYGVEDIGYNPASGLRREMLGPGKMDEHIKTVHKMVWLSKGGKAGWWPLHKFHPRLEE